MSQVDYQIRFPEENVDFSRDAVNFSQLYHKMVEA